MKEYKVIEILGEPEKMQLRLDDTHLSYWGIPVKLQHEEEILESIVTFDRRKKARQLQIGDVFMR